MKVLILGAGPAGLTLANRLKDNGVDSFIVLEKESEAGGLCRTRIVDGIPVDIGGPHFLDDRDPDVVEYLFRFMPKNEWQIYARNSKILMSDGQIIGSPIESFIWQLKREDQIDYLESISQAGCNRGTPMPEKYVDWIYWKLGDKIAENYMLPYNKKLYGENVADMGTYWLYKLPSVSFRETIMSCLDHKFYGKYPCQQTIFYYNTKVGYGEVWNRMADRIKKHVYYNSDVQSLDLDTRTVTTSDGTAYTADVIITTIPWQCFRKLDGMPTDLIQKVSSLRSRSLEVRWVKEELDTDGTWIYCPDDRLPFHRATMIGNLDPSIHGMLVETMEERLDMYKDNYKPVVSYMNEFAYPVHTIGKPEIMKELLSFARSRNVLATGRWGEHMHHNSDITVRLAMEMADEIQK